MSAERSVQAWQSDAHLLQFLGCIALLGLLLPVWVCALARHASHCLHEASNIPSGQGHICHNPLAWPQLNALDAVKQDAPLLLHCINIKIAKH